MCSLLAPGMIYAEDRPAFLEGDTRLGLTKTAILKELEQNGGEAGGQELRDFHHGAIDAVGRLQQILIALQNGGDVDIPPASLEDNDKLNNFAYKYTGEVTHYVYGLEQIARLAFAQRGENLKDRREWLKGFLDNMTGAGDVHNPDVAKNAYAGDVRLEQTRLAYGIHHISRTCPGFERKGPVLIGGVGKGRVEGPAIDLLKEGGEVFDPEVKVIGLDGRPPADPYPGMEMKQGNLEEMVETFPDWIKKMNLLILMGSVTSNMNLLIEQVRYWLEMAATARDGAFMYLNLAAIEPLGEQNERRKRSRAFAVQTGNMVGGSLPINLAYKRNTDLPGETGARIPFLSELEAMARFAKWQLLNLPPRGTDEWRALMDIANDEERLREATDTVRDPMEMPFYLASKSDRGTTVRMDLVFRHDSYLHDDNVKGAEILLQSILDELLRKQDP